MQYLVEGSGGPGFMGPDEVIEVLEEVILPTFEHLAVLESNGTIRAGGLPVADRGFVFVVEASSNDEVDQLVRDIPAWGALDWTVTPLQSFSGRATKEREVLEQLRQAG
jgi:hypothetical protein